MKVLVTGSEGFVGRHVVTALKDRGDTVIGYDKKSGHDLSEPLGAFPAYHGFSLDAIVHLAASCSTPGSVADPLGTFMDTVMTTATVMGAAQLHKTPVILTSSVKARDGMTPYGAAKRMAELWALEYQRSYRLPVIVNRPGTIYGPGQEGSPESGWVAWFLEAKRTGQTVTINGDGTQIRDLLHVSDYVRLLLTQLDNIDQYAGDTIYDVGGGHANAVSVNDMVAHLGLDHVYGPPRDGDADTYVALNNAPLWSPQVHWRDSETLCA